MRVHLFVHEPEGQRLVSYKRLVVALGVRDGFLVMATVHEGPHDVPHVPVFVFELFKNLNQGNKKKAIVNCLRGESNNARGKKSPLLHSNSDKV